MKQKVMAIGVMAFINIKIEKRDGGWIVHTNV